MCRLGQIIAMQNTHSRFIEILGEHCLFVARHREPNVVIGRPSHLASGSECY